MPIYRRQSHSLYYCQYHLVFVSRYRRKVFKDGMGAYLLIVLERSRKLFPEVQILTKETDIDHVHLLVSIPPKYSVAEVVGYMKGKSAYVMKRRFPHLKKVFHGCDGMWSDGYFVSTVGVNEEVIRKYIEHQGKEDRGQATLEL